MDLAMQTFWVIDVEGNGGSPPEIVELAMIEVSGLKLTGRRRNWLIKPGQPITAAVSRIHGLTDRGAQFIGLRIQRNDGESLFQVISHVLVEWIGH